MTGETDPVPKHTLQNCINKKAEAERSGEGQKVDRHGIPSPVLMSGTKVLSGEGRMLILVVGEQSCIGKIRALLTTE
jgi:magnesium-transporting ATPase (P-type)